MTKTLGERLREQEAERSKHGDAASRERRLVGEDRFKANEAHLRAFYEKVKASLIHDIEANVPIATIEMSDGQPFVFGIRGRTDERLPSDSRHPYHHVWAEFETWLKVNDLQVGIDYAHDGGGMRSWYNVKVAPRVPEGE
jgi:hypothetical protein